MKRKSLVLVSILFCSTLCSCKSKASGLNQLNQYFDSYSSFVEGMKEFQKFHKEKEKIVFELENNYDCISKYGCKGVCYCSLEDNKNISHIEGYKCPYFYYREPFYKLNNGEPYYDDCFVYYLDKVDFDANSLYWDAFISNPDNHGKKIRPDEYCLKDKNGLFVTKVQCFSHFEKKEQILDDILIKIKDCNFFNV